MHRRSKTSLKSSVSVIALLILMTACSVGPNYKKPETSLPAAWVSAEKNKAQLDNDEIQQQWWDNFHDPILSQLVVKASTSNLDLKIAEARIAEARSVRSNADASLLPSGDLKATGMREANQLAIPGNFPGINQPFNIFQTGFDASWELDLFGGHRREIEQANADLEASEASRDDVVVSLMAEVARTYVDVRQNQEQLALTEDTIKSDGNTLRINQQRFNVGDAPRFDVTQAEALLRQAETQLPYYRNLIAQDEYSMDVLLGEQPGTAHILLGAPGPVPTTDKQLVLAAPAAVIANRPDIRMAERKLGAATAQQGVAVAKFFPDISLQGFVGFLNNHANDLIESASKSWLIGGSVVWPILSYGTLSANLDSANAQQQEAMATYRKTIITALSDVERSVTAYQEQEKFRQALELSVQSNKHADVIARQRYKEGLTSFLEVLDTQRTLYTSQIQLAQADAAMSQDLVAVYKSLGGGWKVSPTASNAPTAETSKP